MSAARPPAGARTEGRRPQAEGNPNARKDMMKSRPLLFAAIGLALLVLFPVVTDNAYYIHLVETISIYAILLFGLDIVVGYTGQVSLGHAGLFGIGAYTAGVLFIKLGTPLLLTLVGGVAVTATPPTSVSSSGAVNLVNSTPAVYAPMPNRPAWPSDTWPV